MLIRNAEIHGFGIGDVRTRGDHISAVGHLEPIPGEHIVDAAGGYLIPGLHDHHLHLMATAAARSSVQCGPPNVSNLAELGEALACGGSGWIRGIGYHESAAGMLDASLLDALEPTRPVRIQHRSGRMWFLNSAALDQLLASSEPPAGLERKNGQWTGRLFDEDAWLRTALHGTPPSLGELSRELARSGVTGVTDMSPRNELAEVAEFARQQSAGELLQGVVVAGTLQLAAAAPLPNIAIGPAKLHLHEWQIPDLNETVAFIRTAHEQDRAVAVHCTTEVELVFALAAIGEAGAKRGDRIEHAGIATDENIVQLAALGLQVVSQPHFIAERGDQYLADVEPHDHALLYRLAAFERAGVVLAAGSDAPYGGCDPWQAMRAAVSRRTSAGAIIGASENLTPEAALALYLKDPLDLTTVRKVEAGNKANLCLLRCNWSDARTRLTAEDVRLTIINGSIVHDSVDEAPTQRGFG